MRCRPIACLVVAVAVFTLPGICISRLHAQESEAQREIETDRDSFTPALTTVERRRMMVESAWTYIDNKEVADSHSLPELLLRYGINAFQLELGPLQTSANIAMDLPENLGFGVANPLDRVSEMAVAQSDQSFDQST